jgi:hypothetical protein
MLRGEHAASKVLEIWMAIKVPVLISKRVSEAIDDVAEATFVLRVRYFRTPKWKWLGVRRPVNSKPFAGQQCAMRHLLLWFDWVEAVDIRPACNWVTANLPRSANVFEQTFNVGFDYARHDKLLILASCPLYISKVNIFRDLRSSTADSQTSPIINEV